MISVLEYVPPCTFAKYSPVRICMFVKASPKLSMSFSASAGRSFSMVSLQIFATASACMGGSFANAFVSWELDRPFGMLGMAMMNRHSFGNG